MHDHTRQRLWKESLTLSGSATLKVAPDVLVFGGLSALILVVALYIEHRFQIELGLAVAPFEIIGAALGLLLILRTNAGYDRWWEARKLWGGIVNQTRNLVISGLSYGPADKSWRDQLVRWAATFPHVARSGLRRQSPGSEVVNLLGEEDFRKLGSSDHPPTYVALRLAILLRSACEQGTLDRLAFLQIDKERAALIDHIGACERILNTPLAKAYSIKIRRFLLLFLLTLPFVLLHRLESVWLMPFLTMLVAYPLLALDRIGSELQNPFSEQNLSHLPLNDISCMIERNVLALLLEVNSEPAR